MVTPVSSSRRFLAQGDKLGKYEVIRQIAVGGMAELYLTRTLGIEGFEKLACVKRILPQYINNPSFVNMFLNEARLAATLHHANIAQVYDIGQEAGEYFFSMEYVHGEDLGRLVATSRENGVPISLDCTLTLITGLCAGLHYAHEKPAPDGKPLGVVHRDVSPTNVLVSYDGAVKLVDFGIARAGGEPSSSQTGLKGKISYMSPEQCRGRGLLDRRSDVFSIGTILYELTTGRLPFVDETEYGVLNQIVNRDADPPSTVVPGYPPALEAIVMRALARDVEQRFSSALELQHHLEDFAHENRLRVSPLVLARLMSTLFPARLEEWEHARAQGAFFVEQHVVRTLIESGKTADSAPYVPRPLTHNEDSSLEIPIEPGSAATALTADEGPTLARSQSASAQPAGASPAPPQQTLRGIPRMPGVVPSQAAPGASASPGLRPLPSILAPGTASPPPLPGVPAAASGASTPDSSEVTILSPVPGGARTANAQPTVTGVASPPPHYPSPSPQAPSSPSPSASPPMPHPSQPPPYPSQPSNEPAAGPGRPSQTMSAVGPQVATTTTADSLPGVRAAPRDARTSGVRPAPVPNMPGAVPILAPPTGPMVPSGGTLVSSATLAGTLPPAVLPSQASPSGLAGFAGQNPRVSGQGMAVSFGMQGASAGMAPLPSTTPSASGGYAPAVPVALSGFGDTTDRVSAAARARAAARPTLLIRHSRSRFPWIALAVVGVVGAGVGVWLVLSRAGATAAAVHESTVRMTAEPSAPAATGSATAPGAASTTASPGGTAAAATEPPAPAAVGGSAAATLPTSNTSAEQVGASSAAAAPTAAPPSARPADAPAAPAEPAHAAPPAEAAPQPTAPSRVAAPARGAAPAHGATPTVAAPTAANGRPAAPARSDSRKPAKTMPSDSRAKAKRPRRAPKADQKEQTWDDDSPFMPVATPKR